MLKDIYLSGNSKRSRLIYLSGYLLLPLILYAIPLEWLKNQHSVCLFKLITGKECLGCGMTRAVFSALHFQFSGALAYNKLVIIVLPVLVFIWMKGIYKLWSSLKN